MCMNSSCMCFDCTDANEERTFYEYSENNTEED